MAPFDGLIVRLGGVASAAVDATVSVTGAEFPVLPAASYAIVFKVWVPLSASLASHENWCAPGAVLIFAGVDLVPRERLGIDGLVGQPDGSIGEDRNPELH